MSSGWNCKSCRGHRIEAVLAAPHVFVVARKEWERYVLMEAESGQNLILRTRVLGTNITHMRNYGRVGGMGEIECPGEQAQMIQLVKE